MGISALGYYVAWKTERVGGQMGAEPPRPPDPPGLRGEEVATTPGIHLQPDLY